MTLDRIVLWVWLVIGALTLAGGLALPGLRRRLLPPQRRRAVPWSGFEIFFAILLVLGQFWPAVLGQVLTGIGFFTHVYGPDFAAQLGPEAPSHVRELALLREAVWLKVLAFPLTFLSVLLLLRLASDTRPYQLGLTAQGLVRNALLGLLAWVSLTPCLYLVLALATAATRALFHVEPAEHPLTELSQTPLSGLEWFLLVSSAVVEAPVLEELLFRGVVQPWLARRPWGAVVGMAGALVAAFALRKPEAGWLPVVFVLVLVPGIPLLWRLGRSPVAPAICATSLFWAMMHANIWPTPVPLFVLGLGLGYLAYRTQSLVAPLVLHALFNGVACLMLLYPQLAPAPVPPPKGNPTTSAARGPAAVSTSTAVPGSWLPRRRYASAIGPSRGDTTDDATCPTSSPPRSTRAPVGAVPSPWSFRPSSVRLTWPRSRAMTIGSWPR
jgi:membrane protease YdiL (CAAX protease family)